MGKISNYASALKAKLTDYFVIASNNNGVLETKKVTTEQIGDAVASDQVHSSLNTSNKTLIGGINEVNSNVGDLSALTTTDKSSLVGAVNEVVGAKADKITLGTYNFSGVWSPSFYSSRSMFIPFANANDYTITLIRARYASDNTTMNDITSTAQIPTGGISEVGIQVTTTTNCDLKYGDIQLKFE